ncbi:MAG: alpha-N-arabinofuranosidase, partial [Bacteroidota bacterium]
MIYGNFAEHLGRCIYGGIYEPSSPQAGEGGFRKDVIAGTKELGVSLVRWPGGNFVSGYHWMDGIGDRSLRPVRKDLAWGDFESNQVGTDEFLHWAKLAGVEPYICINAGTGTLDEARDWVEYVNGKGTYFATLRGKNGHPEPYGVKYWGLGNEIDGDWQIGHKNAEDYGKFALEAAKMMKWADPTIKLIASGSSYWRNGEWTKWNRTVLNYTRDYIDYLSLHYYTGNYDKSHNTFMARMADLEEKIRITEGMINEVRHDFKVKHPIYIALDEYNVWYRAGNEQKLEEKYNLQDALVVGSYLNVILRHANTVKMANMAQLVNVIAPMFITDGKLWYQTTFYPLALFATHCNGQSLDVMVQSPVFDAGEQKSVPYLDVSAAWKKESNELVLNVVNRHETSPITTDLISQWGKFSGKATVYEVNSGSLMDENSAAVTKVKTTEKQVNASGDRMNYTFPAHSFTMIRVKVQP